MPEMDRDTIGAIWALSYIVWAILVFGFGQVELWPLLWGLIFGSAAGGLVSLFAGLTWGFIAMVAFVAWHAWYIYGQETQKPGGWMK